MRHGWFTDRCRVCGERSAVRAIERGIRREVINCCAGCINRIKKLLKANWLPAELVDQGVLFRGHDYRGD